MRFLLFIGTLLLAAPARAELQVLPGSSPQSALIGEVLPNAVRVRVTENGTPARDAWVVLHASFVGYPRRGLWSFVDECRSGDLEIVCSALTNADGVAQFVGLTSDAAAAINVRVEAVQGDRRIPGEARLNFEFRPGELAGSVMNDLWWGGASENGWGLSTLVEPTAPQKFFNVLFVYDENGAPTWYVQPNGPGVLNRPGLRYSAPIYSPRSAPWYAYSTASFVPGAPVGTLVFQYFGSDAAVLSVDVGGQFTAKHLRRQDFSGEEPVVRGHAGMWWGGPTQNGWGFAIHEQAGNLFIVWFTYDADGKPVWFVMPSSTRSGATYSGPIYRTRGSPWSGLSYDASQLEIVTAGSYVLHAGQAGDGRMTFDYQFEGRSGRLELMRQRFD